jgi:hypothetical protein
MVIPYPGNGKKTAPEQSRARAARRPYQRNIQQKKTLYLTSI